MERRRDGHQALVREPALPDTATIRVGDAKPSPTSSCRQEAARIAGTSDRSSRSGRVTEKCRIRQGQRKCFRCPCRILFHRSVFATAHPGVFLESRFRSEKPNVPGGPSSAVSPVPAHERKPETNAGNKISVRRMQKGKRHDTMHSASERVRTDRRPKQAPAKQTSIRTASAEGKLIEKRTRGEKRRATKRRERPVARPYISRRANAPPTTGLSCSAATSGDGTGQKLRRHSRPTDTSGSARRHRSLIGPDNRPHGRRNARRRWRPK